MKYLAFQIEPEYQESPFMLFYPESFEFVSVFGNTLFRELFSSEVAPLMRVLNNPSFSFWLGEASSTKERRDVLEEWFCNFPKYLTDDNIEELSDMIRKSTITDYAKIFSMITGKPYRYSEITGGCQRDWNYVFWNKDDMPNFDPSRFEVEYYNEGSQWRVEDMDSNVIVDYIYSTNWRMEEIRDEIAAEIGVSPDDVVLFEFDGYKRFPNYKEVVFD